MSDVNDVRREFQCRSAGTGADSLLLGPICGLLADWTPPWPAPRRCERTSVQQSVKPDLRDIVPDRRAGPDAPAGLSRESRRGQDWARQATEQEIRPNSSDNRASRPDCLALAHAREDGGRPTMGRCLRRSIGILRAPPQLAIACPSRYMPTYTMKTGGSGIANGRRARRQGGR